MSSTQQAQPTKSKRAKREELFKREQGRMLQGYAPNSFQPLKQHSRKRDRQVPKSKPSGDDLAAGRSNSNQVNNYSNTQKLGQNDKSLSQQQQFANILDQISLNSSSKNPLNEDINKENKALIQTLPSQGGHGQINLNKSRSGMIASGKGNPIEMRIEDASVTINPNAGHGGVTNGIALDDVQIKIRDDANSEEDRKLFELNKQQFELEDPYAQSQKINRDEFRRGSSKTKARGGSREGRHRSHRGNKVSSFEKYEEIRFACYELQQKLATMTQMVAGVASQLGDQSNSRLNMQNQTIEVPISFIEQLQTYTQEVGADFGSVQNQWSDYFGEQQLSSQRQRSKNRQIKKKLRDIENQNQQQSMIYMRDQQEFERSLQTITKAHDANQDQMGQYLDQIESQVSQLKNTRDDLNGRYEGQLDAAVKEMVNFYENLESADPADIDSDNMSIEQVFFIKPTHQITQTIQQRGKSQLRLSPRVLSSEDQAAGRARSHQSRQTPSNVKIPKLPFERLQRGWEPEQPKIMLEKQAQSQAVAGTRPEKPESVKEGPILSNVASNQEQPNIVRNDEQANIQQQMPDQLPIERAEASSTELDKQATADPQALSSAIAKAPDNGEDYVTNPVMLGAMPIQSGWDHNCEDSQDGANVTMDMATDRLQQFPEAYQDLSQVEDPNERIILKQLLFMKYERILQKQAKAERKRKKKEKKMREAAAAAEAAEKAKKKEATPGSAQKSRKASAEKKTVRTFAPTPTNKNTQGRFGKIGGPGPALAASRSRGSLGPANESSTSSKLNPRPDQGLGMNERGPEEINATYIATSRFSLQSELPSLDTVDVLSAQRKFRQQDVNRTELLDCEEVVADGLKTATQTSLVRHYDEAFRQKELIRNQHKGEEKKINYNSTNQSKMSLAGRQPSQGEIKNNYASNNSNQGQPIYIAESEEYSLNSDLKDLNRVSSKNLQAPQVAGNLDLSGMPSQQYSVKSKKSTQQPGVNFGSNHDRSFIQSQDPHSQEKADRQGVEQLQVEMDQDNSLAYPPEMRQEESADRPVDASLASGASQYQRYLENEEGSPSVHIKNSYAQSDPSPSQLQIDDTIPNDNFDQIQEGDDNQNQEYLDHRLMHDNMMRQRLPLDVIQERQSEFSQSMMTNAARMNTNRSKLSRASKNHGASHYQNLNPGASFHQQPGGVSALASVRSDINNQSSANRKDSTHGITQESINNDTGKMNRKTTEMEDYRFLVRSNSQAHTHRGAADNSLNQSGHRMQHHASIGDQQVCIDGSLIQHSRNTHRKNSNSSREVNDREYHQLYRQPSAGKLDNQNRHKLFQNFEQDISNMLMPGIQGQSKAQMQKNKSQGARDNKVPPLANSKSGGQDKRENRNNEIYQTKDSRNGQSYANDSSQNLPANSEQEKQNQSYQPHSYRSHNIHGGESMRDRSYFDESPALFDNNCANDGGITSQQRATERGKDTILGTYSSQQVEDTLQAHVQSLKSGQGDIVDPSQQHRFDASIHTHLLQMQSIPSFPQSSCHSTARERQSKHSRAAQQHLAVSKGSQPVSGLAESLTHQDLNLDNTLENQGMLSGSLAIKPENGKHELEESPRKPFELIRSNSECQLRDKEFYDMCADEDEVAMYCKLAEQNIFDAIHVRNLSQSHIKANGNTQISESPAQMFTSNMNITNANKSSSIHNHLVFMSQQTYKKMCGRYMQTQEKTQVGHQIGQIASATSGVVDQNSSQQQTRGKGTFKRFLGDPSRLLMSINGNGQGNPQAMNNYLGLNLLASSLDDGTLSNNIMMPTHKYNRRTLLMMQNLHNNYLYSNHSGILFTMQRGWNSGYSAVGGVHDGFQNLTGLNAAAGMTADKGPSQNDGALKSLGGDPVNITSLLMGARQQTVEPLNAGSITIVDDDGKHMIDRKLLLEANNSASQQTNARRLLSQSRNINGQVTATSDFSSLQTKQLGILRNTYAATSLRAANNPRKTSDSALDSAAPVVQPTAERDAAGTPVHLSCYGSQPDEPAKHRKDSGADRSSDSMRQSKCSSTDDKAAEPKRKQFKTLNSQDNKNKIKNLLVGLKQIQQKNPTTTQRSGSDLSFEKQNPTQEKLVSTFKTNVLQLQKKKLSGNGNYQTITTVDSNAFNKVPTDYEANGNYQTQKGPLNGISRSNSSKSKIQNHLQQIIKKQQQQKNQMELSSTGASGAPQASQHTSKTFQMVQQASQPGQTPSNSCQMMNGVTNMLKKEKVKLLVGGEQTKQSLSKQDMLLQNETIQNFNTINGASRGNSVSNPAIIFKKQANDGTLRVPTEPNSSNGGNRKITMRTNRGNSTSLGQASGLIKKIKQNGGGGISSARNSAGPDHGGDAQMTTLTSNGGKPVLKKRILANQSLSQNLKQFKNAMLK